jgi:hypothetical protein
LEVNIAIRGKGTAGSIKYKGKDMHEGMNVVCCVHTKLIDGFGFVPFILFHFPSSSRDDDDDVVVILFFAVGNKQFR